MPRLLQLILSFAKIGTIAYGGGPAMLPVIQAEVVDGQDWTTDEDFGRSIAIGYMLPGPIAPKIAFWVGLQAAGFLGAVVAVVAMEIPSLAGMYVLMRFFGDNIEGNLVLMGAAKGATIGVVGLLAYLVYNQAEKVFITPETPTWLKGISTHPEWVLLIGVVFALSMWKPDWMVPLSLVGSAIFGAVFLR